MVNDMTKIPRRFRRREQKAKAGNLRSTRKKMARIIHLLENKNTDLSNEILVDAKKWKNVTSKSHWPLMNRLGKKHEDVLAKIDQIKQDGGMIIRRYNLNFGTEEAV